MGLSRRIKILIIDDEEIIRLSLQKILKEMGYVETASNGDEASGMIKKCRYDLIITDLKMPGLSGLELLAKIKKEGIKSIVIIISAYLSPDIIKKATELGVFKCIDKPFRMDDFLYIIKEAIEQRVTPTNQN